MIVVSLAGVHPADGQILLARRADYVPSGGLWETPGGKIESGESPEQAIQREWLEELGVEVYLPRVLDVVRFPDFPESYLVLLGAVLHDIPARPMTPAITDIQWVPPAQVFGWGLTPGTRLVLARNLRRIEGLRFE